VNLPTPEPSQPDPNDADARELSRANVWVLSDGRAGHLGTTRGILRSLAQIRPLNEHWIELHMRLGAVRQVMHYWLHGTNHPVPRWLQKACYRIGEMPAARPDLILSTGGSTVYLNASFARQFDCPNLFAGTLRGLRSSFFSAVITPFRLEGVNNNIELDYLPLAVDPAKAAQAGEQYRLEHCLNDERLWTMIIGGDGGGYRYTDADWAELAQAMNQLAQQSSVRWLLTTSRRTGAQGEAVLRKHLDEAVLADAVWWTQEPRKVMLAYLGASQCVFCTEESGSMITESILSGRAAFALRARRNRPQAQHLRFLEAQQRLHRLRRLSMADMARFDVNRSLGDFAPVDQAQVMAMNAAFLCNLNTQLAERWQR